MDHPKRLPDAEFEVMRAVWDMGEPVTSPMVAERLRLTMKEKIWKPQTIITILTRLEKKGFLSSVKNGKEREYTFQIGEEEYMAYEAGQFFSKFQNGSAAGFLKALYRDRKLEEKDLEELRQWLEEK